MKRASYLIILGTLLCLGACKKDPLKEPLPAKTNPNLAYFGYALVDVGWDDPSDAEVKTNYIDEVKDFCNVADMLVVDPGTNLVDRLEAMGQNGLRAILHLSEIFFEQKGVGGTRSGVIYGIRQDYQARWDTFVSVNNLALNQSYVSCFYIGEEPAWNGIPEAEFTAACDYVKASIPQVPIFSVEAYTAIDSAYTPNSVDWVGFDHYFLEEPSADASFVTELNTLKSLKKAHQKIFLIMDAHWIKIYHGALGIKEKEMGAVARDYYNMANADTSIIGLLGYFWPSGFDQAEAVGARNLPADILEEHKGIGRAITGK